MRLVLPLALVLGLAACAERAPPVRNAVTEGTAHDQDVLECRDQADRNQPVLQAARGALIGAIVGGLFFANPWPAIWTGALAGGVGGAALGAAGGAELERTVDDCLNSRT